MTTQDIFSKIQIAIGDVTFSKIQREEYLQYLEETLGQIAVNANYYLISVNKVPLADEHVISVAFSNNSEPVNLDYVTRNRIECREFSSNSMFTASQDPLNRGFQVNDTPVNEQAYATRIIPPRGTNTDVSLLLYFPVAFSGIEEVDMVISMTADTASLPNRFNDPKVIPLFAYDAVYNGVLSKVLQSLMIRNLAKHGNNWQTVEMIYNRKVKDLYSYIKRLKSRNSFPEIQPLKWMSDSGARVKSGSGIPPEWSSTIINENDRWA